MVKKLVIGISGKQGSGKSTLADMLDIYFKQPQPMQRLNHVFRIKFADPIYKIQEATRAVLESYGFYSMPKKDGRFLQLVGTEWGRAAFGPDMWCDLTRNRIASILAGDGSQIIIVDDCRFGNELDLFADIKKSGAAHVVTVRLQAGEETRRARAESWRENTGHESETSLDGRIGDFDLVINTNPGSCSAKDAFALVMASLGEIHE